MQTTTKTTSETQKLTRELDIVRVILEDHKPLKELIEVMKDDENSHAERFEAFESFTPLLIAHAKPEEEILYTYMKKKSELKEIACEGDVEHGLADQLVEMVKRETDEDVKAAQIKVLAELVEHHIEEEEEELLPDFEKETDRELRMKMGDSFLELKLRYLAAGDDNIIPDPRGEQTEKKASHRTH